MNKIVVHYSDGKIHKGFTRDFLPTRNVFHLISAKDQTKQIPINISTLKAVFFVKDFRGDPHHMDHPGFDPSLRVYGKKLKVTFKDGEAFYGITQGYYPEKEGFFIIPGDPECNIVRAFVVNSFVESVKLL